MTTQARTYHERYATALLADAAFRAGVEVRVAPAAIKPMTSADRLAGPVRTVTVHNDLVSVLGAVHRARSGEVVVLANRTPEVGLLGDLIATEARRNGLAGFVVDGHVRDVPVLRTLGLPVFARGAVPVGPLKLPAALRGIGEIDVEVTLGGARVGPGWWAFGDADGVLFLPAEALDTVYAGAETALARERDVLDALSRGEALGDLLEVEEFLRARAADPAADFNRHLERRGRAI